MTARDRTGAAALVGAAVTGLAAFALILAGGLLLWANGHYKDADGYLSTGSERFLLKSDRYGELRLQTMRKGGKPLFVGIAPTRDVRAWLTGTAYSEVSDIDYAPFKAVYAQHLGTREPGPPARQGFWAATGTHALQWHVESGDWSVVVMNADASPGVQAQVSAGASIPFLGDIAWAALGMGLVLLLSAGGLLYLGVRGPGGPTPRTEATPVPA
jgi:hypothetical protein